MSEFSLTRVGPLVTSSKENAPSAVHDEVVQFFGELRIPLLRYLNTIGLPVTDGEDVIQDAFLALFRHLRDGKPRDNLHGWVFRVARNLALKRLAQSPAAANAAEYLPVPDPAANPEERAVREQQDRAVRAVVGALPELDRQCLYLRAEGLRYRDIAEALDISVGSVALALSRTLDRLARAAQR